MFVTDNTNNVKVVLRESYASPGKSFSRSDRVEFLLWTAVVSTYRKTVFFCGMDARGVQITQPLDTRVASCRNALLLLSVTGNSIRLLKWFHLVLLVESQSRSGRHMRQFLALNDLRKMRVLVQAAL